MKRTNRWRLSTCLGVAALAVVLVGTSMGCKSRFEKSLTGELPDNPEELIVELQAHKGMIDEATDRMVNRINEYNSQQGPGQRKVQFSELFYGDLSSEQRDVLDELLEKETAPSYKQLLTRIIEDRNLIADLQEKILHLEQRLPDEFIIVKGGDTHLELAKNYLASKGVPEDHAQELLNDIDLNENLIPGFKVWYNYDENKDSFRTYVTKGEAGQTPLAVKRAVKRKLIDERDVAQARAEELTEKKAELEVDIDKLEAEVSGLEEKKGELEGKVSDLVARNTSLTETKESLESDLAFRQNSLYYHAGSEKELTKQGILTKFLENVKDVNAIDFAETLDLRQAQSISFRPGPYGLKSIRDIEVWPQGFIRGRDYVVEVSEKGDAARVVLQEPDVFKQKRILFSVKGKT